MVGEVRGRRERATRGEEVGGRRKGGGGEFRWVTNVSFFAYHFFIFFLLFFLFLSLSSSLLLLQTYIDDSEYKLGEIFTDVGGRVHFEYDLGDQFDHSIKFPC